MGRGSGISSASKRPDARHGATAQKAAQGELLTMAKGKRPSFAEMLSCWYTDLPPHLSAELQILMTGAFLSGANALRIAVRGRDKDRSVDEVLDEIAPLVADMQRAADLMDKDTRTERDYE
jgi:hypothetical protein